MSEQNSHEEFKKLGNSLSICAPSVFFHSLNFKAAAYAICLTGYKLHSIPHQACAKEFKALLNCMRAIRNNKPS